MVIRVDRKDHPERDRVNRAKQIGRLALFLRGPLVDSCTFR